MKQTRIALELPEGQAWAFAQLLKRITPCRRAAAAGIMSRSK